MKYFHALNYLPLNIMMNYHNPNPRSDRLSRTKKWLGYCIQSWSPHSLAARQKNVRQTIFSWRNSTGPPTTSHFRVNTLPGLTPVAHHEDDVEGCAYIDSSEQRPTEEFHTDPFHR